MAGIPIPKRGFLDECVPIGFRNGQKRWKSRDGKRLYTWDSLHGEIEVFNAQGFHLGVLNVQGVLKKGAIKGRRINV